MNKERIFVGGNNSLIGPLKSDFGVMTAADSKLKGTLSKGDIFLCGSQYSKVRLLLNERNKNVDNVDMMQAIHIV